MATKSHKEKIVSAKSSVKPVIEEETPKPVIPIAVAHRQRTFAYDKYLVPAAFVFVLLLVAGFGYVKVKNTTGHAEATPSDKQEIAKVVESVGEHALLPSNEQAIIPTPASVKVALYNGTTTAGLTRDLETTLLEMSSIRVEVTEKTNASSNTYLKSVVVDLTGKTPQSARQFATLVKGEIGELPEGEKKPSDIDILIILGKSYSE